MIKIGKIRGPWGREGELEIDCYSPFPERFSILKEIFIGSKTYKIERVRYFGGKVVTKIKSVNSIEEASKLSSNEIEISEEEVYLLPQDYFYLHDLKGCHVFLKDGREIGVVDYVWEMGESTLLAVCGEKGEILIPFAKSICYSVDIRDKRIKIDPPDGLLELNEV